MQRRDNSLAGRALKVATETHEDRNKWMSCLQDCIAAVMKQTKVHVSLKSLVLILDYELVLWY